MDHLTDMDQLALLVQEVQLKESPEDQEFLMILTAFKELAMNQRVQLIDLMELTDQGAQLTYLGILTDQRVQSTDHMVLSDQRADSTDLIDHWTEITKKVRDLLIPITSDTEDQMSLDHPDT